jgi:RNA-binding protein
VNAKQKKKFRAIGHGLKPAVTVAGKGLSESVLTELNRALDDHELIKVKIVADRDDRKAVVDAIGKLVATEIIQTVGGVALVYRPAREPNPALSNIVRAGVL